MRLNSLYCGIKRLPLIDIVFIVFTVSLVARIVTGIWLFTEILDNIVYICFGEWRLQEGIFSFWSGSKLCLAGHDSIQPVLPFCYLVLASLFPYSLQVAIFVFHCLISSLTCVAVMILSFRVFKDKLAALLGGLVMAVLPGQIRYDLSIDDTVLFNLFFMLTLYLSVSFIRIPGWRTAILFGIATGITFLTKAAVLPFIFMVCIVVVVLFGKKAVLSLGVMLVAFSIVVSIYGLRNYMKHGDFAMSDFDKWYTVHVAHNEMVDGLYLEYGASVVGPFLQDLHSELVRKEQQLYGPYHADLIYRDALIKYALENPLSIFGRILVNFTLYFSPIAFPRRTFEVSEYRDGKILVRGSNKLRLVRDFIYSITFIILFIPSIVCLVRNINSPAVLMLFISVISLAMIHSLAGVSIRYSQSANYFYAILASYWFSSVGTSYLHK